MNFSVFQSDFQCRHRRAMLLWLCLTAITGFGLASAATAQRTTLQLSDGSDLELLFFSPKSADSQQSWPLALMVAGGSGNDAMVRAQLGFGSELLNRGWAIAVPLSPDGQPFAETGDKLLPLMLAALRNQHPQLSARTLLVGMSSGGSAALQIGTTIPEHFIGILVVPGRIDASKELADLAQIPIFIRIGEKDYFQWDRDLSAMTTRLREAGAIVDSELVPGGRHVFSLDWGDIDPWLDGLPK